MTFELAIWFALSVITDVSGQICFKLGANNVASRDASAIGGFWVDILSNGWTIIGVLIYALEFVVWLRILSIAPLSLAYPIASINFLGVVAASRIFLKERVGPRRLIGSTLITLGVALVAGTA